MIAGLALAVLTGWSTYATWGFIETSQALEDKDLALAEARSVYRHLADAHAAAQAEWSATGDRFLAVTGSLGAHSQAVAATLDAARERIAWLQGRLARARSERAALEAAMIRVEADLHDMVLSADGYTVPGLGDEIDGYLWAAGAGESVLAAPAVRLREAAETVGTKLDALASSRREILRWVGDQAADRIAFMEQLMENTGLDPDVWLRRTGEPGAGGPFVAATPADPELRADASALEARLARWDTLRGLVDDLPVAAPLAGFTVRSAFGPRRDPFNGRRAMHNGVDLDAPYKSPVQATAPGRVAYAGWRRGYGRLVEIHHSPRLKTRFAHLAVIRVEKGQRVDRGDIVGLLGSSGRSSGAHLHYEIIVDGVPRDPMTFIRMGQAVALPSMP